MGFIKVGDQGLRIKQCPSERNNDSVTLFHPACSAERHGFIRNLTSLLLVLLFSAGIHSGSLALSTIT